MADTYTNPEPNQVNNPLAVMQEGEKVICDIKRHPIGIILVYLGTGLFLICLALMMFVLLPSVLPDNDPGQLRNIGVGVFGLFSILTVGFVLITNFIYLDNHLVVTSDSVTEIARDGIFKRQSSQLSLGNLEDVTSTKNNFLQHLFNYGTLTVETAGEHVRFVFPYCPRPDFYGQQILAAREVFEQGHRGGKTKDTPSVPPEPADVDSYEIPS